MSKTKIEYVTDSWNPIRAKKGLSHCVKISDGCKNCYAEPIGRRFHGGLPYTAEHTQAASLYLDHGVLNKPLRWRKPRTVFVCSTCDLFQLAVPESWIAQIMTVATQLDQHRFLFLTKRADRMATLLTMMCRGRTLPKNVWFGVSAENQERLIERMTQLEEADIGMTQTFVSLEPLLGPVDLSPWLETLRWVIVGGESGPGARPCDVEWIRDVVRQCKKVGVPCFVKQVGAHYVDAKNGIGGVLARPPTDIVPPIRRLLNRKGADPSEWPKDLRVRELPWKEN